MEIVNLFPPFSKTHSYQRELAQATWTSRMQVSFSYQWLGCKSKGLHIVHTIGIGLMALFFKFQARALLTLLIM